MNYQTYLNDLFAATSLPVCCFAPDGRERALLLPSRFADKAAFAERQREAAHAFARNTGDPLFLTGAQSTGGLRLPDLSVVLIGPAQRPGRQKVRQQTAFFQVRTANLWLRLVNDLILQDIVQSPSGEQIEHKLQELIPPELADKMKNQLLKTPHNQYRHEAGIMEAIRSGDVQQVKNAFKVPLGGSIGILAPDPLRSLKNHANLMNVLASRVAISAGVSSEEAFSLSDKFFFAAENCRTQAEAWQLREDIAAAFALQIKSYRDRLQQGESHLVRKARELMHQAVFSKSSIAEIAAQAGCSPDHLEVLFKATCGLTLRQYQLKVKLDTAKELLLHSDCTVGDIASLLHFASASHFCSAFSRQEGFTPLQYRNHNR